MDDKRNLIHVSTWANPTLAEAFRQVAEREHRSVSGELRRLMEQRIAEAQRERGSERAAIPG